MNESRGVLRALVALVSGTVFGLGLAVAQMTDPRKVLGFLDIAGPWDASLLFVLGAATGLYAVTYRFIRRRAAPVLDAQFHWPKLTSIDTSLVVGSALFGVGWGMAGYCPGPAVASMGFANAEALWVLPSILAGIGLQRVSRRWLS
jgi:uncharacterized membrane protein YedE/YeeE